jgi:SWI/SNF-related matrix-associated actin-dependent regulator 1 of chromatin subfamily A
MQLKPHQESGADWLASKRLALLADEMRVGKTLTAIEAAKRIGARSILVVCPAVARFNWARELSGWLLRAAWPITTRAETVTGPGLYVVSYDLVKHLPADAKWDVLILDESHQMRHMDTQRTKLILGADGLVHRARRTWALSGTPAVNHYGELWHLLYVFGAYKHSYEKYIDEFCITRYDPYSKGKRVVGNKNPKALRKILEPVMLRRRFAEVAPELPPIEIENYLIECPAGVEFEGEKVLADALASNDPIGALEAATPYLSSLRRLIGMAKAEGACDLVQSDLDGNKDKVVVFTYHRAVLDYMADKLIGTGIAVVDGRMSARARDFEVRRFQNQKSCRVFLGQIIAAGTNIDLSAAAGAYVVESSWTPGENAQALMRLQNLNNTMPKWARFVSMADSIDEHVNRTVARKTRDLNKLFG